jgi:oxygen-dependent protoporphyrinogen oxidase
LINNGSIKELIDELGLKEQIIEPDEQAIKSRFVLKNGNIEAIPTSLKSAIKSNLIGWGTLASILSEPFKKAKRNGKEESLAEFSKRRFGNQIYEDLITPFVTGIYAGDPEKMSIDFTLSILKEAEEKHGSILKGMPKLLKLKKASNEKHQLPEQKIFTFKRGLQTLAKAIASELDEAVKLNAQVFKIEKKEGSYAVHFKHKNEQKTVLADQVVSTLPAAVLADLIETENPTLSQSLKKVSYVPATVTHLAYDKQQLNFKKEAFGILSRKSEQVPFLGVLFNSKFFPHQAPKNKVLITVISGGYRQADFIHRAKTEIQEEIHQSLIRLNVVQGDFEFASCYHWPKAIPQYELGHQDILDQIAEFEAKNPNFLIAGNFLKGISVSDCIENSFKLAVSLK